VLVVTVTIRSAMRVFGCPTIYGSDFSSIRKLSTQLVPHLPADSPTTRVLNLWFFRSMERLSGTHPLCNFTSPLRWLRVVRLRNLLRLY
jgi:hypothetical protein